MPYHRFFQSALALVALTAVACGEGNIDQPSDNSAQNQGSSSGTPDTPGTSSGNPAQPEGPGVFTGTPAAPMSKYIVVDQFGYMAGDEKIAVIRDPQSGFDGGESFAPGANYALVNAETDEKVFSGAPTPWNGGAEDGPSGDRAFWFDFSSISAPGWYYVLDADQGLRSDVFRIGDNVYRDVLKHALRTFFYQRAGQEKAAKFAGDAWADGASHVGPLQDHNCRLFSAPNDASTEKDLSGGWYDAGDYNKYTNWHASYVVGLLKAYAERPAIWGDDYNIPESGNGIADVLDEVKWGMDWLVRMQNADGSVLSIVGEAMASPPSAAKGQSFYGPANTSATLSTAAAFALGSTVFRSVGTPEMNAYADALLKRAQDAWAWAEAHPNVLFYNNDWNYGSQGLGAGQQETDDYGRLIKRLEAAVYLFEATGTAAYRNAFDAQYSQVHLMQWSYAYPFELVAQEVLLHYAKLQGATQGVADNIKNTYRQAIASGENLGAHQSNADPYLGFLQDYVWGSNAVKANQGLMFRDITTYQLDASLEGEAKRAAGRYIHYLHGVNPLGMVYLSNMATAGATTSVTAFYHGWFTHGSELWGEVGTSTHGPAPGFLVGGPNPSYNWDGCCPNNCGSAENNAICTSMSIEPPRNQPPLKAFKSFNVSWPLNSWEVTENSNGYQVPYIRLLSWFVD